MKKFVSTFALAAILGACAGSGGPSAPEGQAVNATQSASTSSSAPAANRPYRAPRGPDGQHPDLNGVWQVLNTANYNVEAHAAQSALQLRQGPYVPVPAAGVV